MMNDNLSQVWGSFFQQRTVNLFNRFDGLYRALVVETNDPLQMYRIRFKCPELHDFNLKAQQCPWAVPAFALGGKNAGSWEAPMIGDVIWISFEKAHVYGPIWVGFCPGTRRRRYPLEQIYTKSPIAVDADGNPTTAPSDYLQDYIPQDYRPMSNGWRDRYGNSEVLSSVGFFPVEHKIAPAPPGVDGVQRSILEAGDAPVINEPDRKYLARLSKYGIYVIQSDMGYYWNKEGNVGEFNGIGDPLDNGGQQEQQFEIDRYQYFVKLYNEDKPNSSNSSADERRFEVRTRAGHKLEMRDVGWAQSDGGLSVGLKVQDVTSRVENGTYGGQILSQWNQTDERWMKIRTKGGMLVQLMDAGFNPQKDKFYQQKLIDECGPDADDETSANWVGRDSRQIRLVTRYGIKLALDDRLSDPVSADQNESPRGNGFLLKTRRSWEPDGTGTSRGFGIEAIDKDELNTTRYYTPKSKLLEMNDRKDYCLLCTDTNGYISEVWQGKMENEFALNIGMTFTPEVDTYHLKLDKRNGYLRLKTAAGGDNGRNPIPEPENFTGDPSIGEIPQNAPGQAMIAAETGLNQGLEARDGNRGGGADGPWAELVDIDHRGLWFTRNYGMGIWRAKNNKDMYIMISDSKNLITIRNMEDGPIQIVCDKNVEVWSGQDINLQAQGDISLNAGGSIKLQAGSQISEIAGGTIDLDGGGGNWQLSGGGTVQSVPDNAPMHTGYLPGAGMGDGAQQDTGGSSDTLQANDVTVQTQDPIEPSDRAKTNNQPFDAVSQTVITGQ